MKKGWLGFFMQQDIELGSALYHRNGLLKCISFYLLSQELGHFLTASV
jgi:hypothetical protein